MAHGFRFVSYPFQILGLVNFQNESGISPTGARPPAVFFFLIRGAEEQNAEQKTCNVPYFVPQFKKYIIAIYQIVLD